MRHYNEYYSIILFKDHAIAISYKKYSENIYKFTLFNSSSELFESSDINAIKGMLSTYIDCYGTYEINGKQYILFDEYKKSKIINYQSVWNKNDIENNKGVAENLKKIGFALPFKEEILGRVIHYSEQRELILEINRNNKLIEVIVKNVDVDEGLYLVKEVIDKIINNDEIGKVVIYKNEHDDIIVKEVEFGTYKEVKKRKGYIDFNDIYYRELININCYLLKGNKSTELNEIVSLIDKLQGNIYFEKLISGLSLINKINKFNESNENTSLANILNKVKDKLEDKLFYEKLLFGKETLLSLSEKNSFIAARLYQLMISEINEGIKGISNFIYNQIIESPYLSSDKKRPNGIEGYDYTIEFKQNYKYLSELVKHISIEVPELKNTFLITDENNLHLKEAYQKLSDYRSNQYVDELLNFIENEINLIKTHETKIYRDLYFEYFTNDQFYKRMIVHEINQLEYYFINSYREHNYGYHPNNFDIDEKNPRILIKKSLEQNRNLIDCSYLLFDDNKENFTFLFEKNQLFSGGLIDNIIVDSIDASYQDDIIIYFYNGIKSENLTRYLDNNPEINYLIDYCLKNRIRLIATGDENDSIFHQEFIRHKQDVDKLYNIILENQFFNERTLVFAKKEKLLSSQFDVFFIEGVAQRLNMPIYEIVDNTLVLTEKSVIINPPIERQHMNNPLLLGSVNNNVIIAEIEDDNISFFSKKGHNNIKNNSIAKEIDKIISHHYPNYRDNIQFKLEYNDITSAFSSYLKIMTIDDVLDYIEINRYNLDYSKIGKIIYRVDEVNQEQQTKILKKISNNIIHSDDSISNLCHQYFYTLSSFFKTSDKNTIKNKLIQAIYDPSVNKRFNQYLMGKITYEQWNSFEKTTNKKLTLTEKTQNVIEIIHSIYDRPKLINNLSDLSKNLLSSFFYENKKGILYKVVLDYISFFENYKNIINKLENILSMSKNKEIPETLPPAKALEKVSELKKLIAFDSQNAFYFEKRGNKIEINGLSFEKKWLSNLGAKINGKSIENIDLSNIDNWSAKLTFDPHHLNDYFLSISGSEKDKMIISLFSYLLNNKKDKIRHLLSCDTNRIDYLEATERLIKIIELGNKNYDSHDWNNLITSSLENPRHMRIISKIGYANIAYGIWQSVNATFMLAEQLNNPLLTAEERKEIINNLAIMWSEMAYNGLSEVIEITLAKGFLKYRHNPLEYVSKVSTKIGIGLNVLSIGFDIYNAYDNFSRLSDENNEKRRIDYIVNGSMAIVSGLMTIGVSIAMLAGSTVAGPISIVAGAVIALATSIYNAARLIEEAKIKVNFTAWEEFNNGFYAFLIGDVTPDKKNEITYLETEKQLEEIIDKKASDYFDEIKKLNNFSYHFYTNEKQIYEEHYYYKVIPNLMGKTLDAILNPLGEYVAHRLSINLSQNEAEKLAALSYHFRAEKTGYKYFHPKEAIATNEILIFDIDFYVNQLKRYTIDIIPEKDFPIFHQEIDKDFLKGVKTTQANVIDILDTQNELENGLVKANEYKKYYNRQWSGNETLHFSTYNGDDIIAAPCETQNSFDIYNGTKRLSGGNKEDMFILLASESPRYASRFYGREGNDTLRVIKTTNHHRGYEVDLSKNYVKFRNSPIQTNSTNSQNFHSTLFLYEDNGHIHSTQFTDSMPNIKLQDDAVIAYLDSIENVIASEIGDDIIYGNQDDNYLDGSGGVDLLYGLGGNDTLVLQEGYAEGGEGKDNYIVLRSSLEKNYNIQFETIINEESHDETSMVRLNYYFDEIHATKRQGKDIIFSIKVNDGNKNDEPIYHFITLKNSYHDNEGNKLSHRYSLITKDGFMLTIDNNRIDENSSLYNFSYLEQYNSNNDPLQYLYIDENNKLMTLSYSHHSKIINILPQLHYSGFSLGEHLLFAISGNAQNNHYFGITANSSIKLTEGHDNYHIATFLTDNKNDKITISLSSNIKTLTSGCISNLFLSDISGFDLIFSEGILSHRYNPDAHLKLVFNQLDLMHIWDSGMNIRLIDKNNVIFILPNKQSKQRLLIPVADLGLTLTSQDDVLMIPEGLTFNKETLSTYSLYSSDQQSRPISTALQEQQDPAVANLSIIELMEGNDIIVNHNKMSAVIDGGNGNDHIVVNNGHHILIAGEGNDNINGGKGNDLLISEFGHDYLNGGMGNNVYLVKKRHGEVTVYDEGEYSHLFVLGLAENEHLIASKIGDDIQYRTQDNQFVLTVKPKDGETKKPVTVIEKQNALSMQFVTSIIHEMAQFNQQQLTTMQGSEFTPSPTWSPLPFVTKYL